MNSKLEFNRKKFVFKPNNQTSSFSFFVYQLEENRIKKELGEIAMALNLEAQKAKNDMHDFVKYVLLKSCDYE